ncbi:hypothetical protein WA538_002193, partial [Blastocystis sp. DL]
MYSEKDRYQIDKSYMPSTVNLVIKSIEHIQEDLAKRDWNGIASVYGDVTQQLSELNLAAAKILSHFVIVPRNVGTADIPSTLAAFFPKEKLEMDKRLQEDVVSDANAFTTVSEDTILQTKEVVARRNQWSDQLEEIYK